MKPPLKAPAMGALLAACAAFAVACGSHGVQVKGDRGAQLFAERCAGCHTLSAAGTQGSVGERVSGPNLDYRRETKATVLYAIHNGGFSGAIMPQNVVVGKDAEAVAEFVAKYAGRKAKSPPAPTPVSTGTTGASGTTSAKKTSKGSAKSRSGG